MLLEKKYEVPESGGLLWKWGLQSPYLYADFQWKKRTAFKGFIHQILLHCVSTLQLLCRLTYL